METVGVKIEEKVDPEEIFEQIESYRERTDDFVQVFDRSKVVGMEHLLWAYQKAEECFDNGTNRADSIEIETLLWSSGKWQIKNAIDKMGLKEGSDGAALLVDGDVEELLEYMGWERDDDILEASEDKLKAFGISVEEIDSVESPEDLVFEKMATSVL